MFIVEFANSLDHLDAARYGPPYLGLYCLPSSFLNFADGSLLFVFCFGNLYPPTVRFGVYSDEPGVRLYLRQ